MRHSTYSGTIFVHNMPRPIKSARSKGFAGHFSISLTEEISQYTVELITCMEITEGWICISSAQLT